MRIVLPSMIYSNVFETFEELLEAIKDDIMKASQDNEKSECI